MMNKRAVLFLSQLSVLSNCAIRSSAVIIHADIFNIFFFFNLFHSYIRIAKAESKCIRRSTDAINGWSKFRKELFSKKIFLYSSLEIQNFLSEYLNYASNYFSYSESPPPLINNSRLSADIGDTWYIFICTHIYICIRI